MNVLHWRRMNRVFLRCGNRRTYFEKISDLYSKNVEDIETVASVKGWIKSVRKMKTKVFLDIYDGSTYKKLQVIVDKDSYIENLDYGASVEVNGKLKKIPSGQVEMKLESFKIIGPGNLTDNYPFVPRTLNPPELEREHLHLRPRIPSFSCLLRLRDGATRAIHKYFHDKEYIHVHTPILTSNDCEGAGEVFKVYPENQILIDQMMREDKQQLEEEVFFNNKSYLTVSGQLHLECMARALCKVYSFGPTFRAQNSKSRLHLAEFYMVEAEIAFIETLHDILKIMEEFIKNISINMLNNHEDEILAYRKLRSFPTDLDQIKKMLDSDFKIIEYDEAIEILKKCNHKLKHPAIENKPLTREHELCLLENCDNVPIFVINWPFEIKPFYMKMCDDKSKVMAVDFLYPGIGEVCGGGVREDDYDKLEKKIIDMGFSDKLNWYLQLREFGNIRTGGFGMGFERYLQIILGATNIKDLIPFPRWPHNCRQ